MKRIHSRRFRRNIYLWKSETIDQGGESSERVLCRTRFVYACGQPAPREMEQIVQACTFIIIIADSTNLIDMFELTGASINKGTYRCAYTYLRDSLNVCDDRVDHRIKTRPNLPDSSHAMNTTNPPQ